MSPSKSASMYVKAAEGVVPANTKASTHWCVRTFNSWLEQRNRRTADNPGSATPAVSRAIRLFVLEARKVDGQCYQPATITKRVE